MRHHSASLHHSPSPHRRAAALAISALVGLATAAPALADWPPTYAIQRIGLQGPDYVSTLPVSFQQDFIEFYPSSGTIIGRTNRAGVSGGGSDYWFWDGDSTNFLGLTGPDYSGSTGFRSSLIRSFTQQGQIVGSTTRVTGVSTSNGTDAWLYNGTSNILLGLTGPDYTGSTGFRNINPIAQNQAGQVTGTSQRILGVNTSNGFDAWVSNNGTTQQIGLLGDGYQGENAFRSSRPVAQNQSGQIVGVSRRASLTNSNLGQDTWIWNSSTIQQIGLIEGTYLDSNGVQFSEPLFQNDAGNVVGISRRYSELLPDLGSDAWIWNGTNTLQIGLVTPEHTGTTGFRASTPRFLTPTGLVAGTSTRVLDTNTPNGTDAWLWNGQTTLPVGPTGPEYTGSNGFRSAMIFALSDTGQVIGRTDRVTGIATINGADAWASDGQSTQVLGLSGPEYTGTSGYRFSSIINLAESPQILGLTRRVLGDSTDNGDDLWVWNGSTVTLLGLTGPDYTGSNGYRKSSPTSVSLQSAPGKIVGQTLRISGVNTQNGLDVWWFDGTTTRPLGLFGPEYTSATGRRQSSIVMVNPSNVIVGTTSRLAPSGTSIGADAWYFDPATGITTPIIASIGPAGTAPNSTVTFLTDDGYMFGAYRNYLNNTSTFETRAYVFRPDVGLSDLGELVDGGLTANGWASLGSIIQADSFHTAFGIARQLGPDQSQRAFVLLAPQDALCPTCPADYDNDGGVTGADVGAFFADFESGNTCADVDADGGVTGADLATFFASYELGGC